VRGTFKAAQGNPGKTSGKVVDWHSDVSRRFWELGFSFRYFLGESSDASSVEKGWNRTRGELDGVAFAIHGLNGGGLEIGLALSAAVHTLIPGKLFL